MSVVVDKHYLTTGVTSVRWKGNLTRNTNAISCKTPVYFQAHMLKANNNKKSLNIIILISCTINRSKNCEVDFANQALSRVIDLIMFF